MCKGMCEDCKYARYDYVDAYGGGFYAVDGCKLMDNKEKFEEREKQLIEDGVEINYDDEAEWGDTVECPFWSLVEDDEP